MLDLRYEKVVVCDATFGTNDKKVLLIFIFLSMHLFFRINMVFIIINILLVTNLVVYAHGFPRMAKWVPMV
jgi:hypothetical protein